MQTNTSLPARLAQFIIRLPLPILLALTLLGVAGGLGTARLQILSNQLELISQDLPEVKDVKRVIDMVGGSGFLTLALRSEDKVRMKQVADDLAQRLQADTEHIRFVQYRTPVDFIQRHLSLFIQTEDLISLKDRSLNYIRQTARRQNPLFFDLGASEPPRLELDDLREKYGTVAKKTILDDYYISDDGLMLLIFIKPQWDTNELAKTKAFIDSLSKQLATYSASNPHQVNLSEDYQQVGAGDTITYGLGGLYKTAVDDSYAISESLEPIGTWALGGIMVITYLFFRRLVPLLIVTSGVVLGTLLTLGFTYLTIGNLNMITSILAGIMMGFGVDYGIHFIFRMRIELGTGKTPKDAICAALLNAGRPAAVSALVTAGSFFVLLFSGFKGFSQFGLLAGCGTLIIAATMFVWCAAWLSLLSRLPGFSFTRRIGSMALGVAPGSSGSDAIPYPRLLLAGSVAIGLLLCSFAVPWRNLERKAGAPADLLTKWQSGVVFNYNTRALVPKDRGSTLLQDEMDRRFAISADPIAIYAANLQEARSLYDELQGNRDKYRTIDQIVSLFSFVPDANVAEANQEVLAQWRAALADMGISLSEAPPALFAGEPAIAENWPKIRDFLSATPYDVEDLLPVYKDQFYNLPTTKPENHGILTYVYPGVHMWDSKELLQFATEVKNIRTAEGKLFSGAGLPILYARLSEIVLFDAKLTVALTTLWILLIHFLDFRRVNLALISVIPLVMGILMMLGIMNLIGEDLNFMNIITLPILLGFGVSHGLYLLHRFLEGVSPRIAMRSVGAAVASSTLTTAAGFGSLLAAQHLGLRSMGFAACLGLLSTLGISFSVLAGVLQLMYRRRSKAAPDQEAAAPASPLLRI